MSDNRGGLHGRLALVTGASRGIGAASARRLAQLGADLVLVARSADAVDMLAKELDESGANAQAMPADLGDRSSLDTVMDRIRDEHGRLDILMNNAGNLPVAQPMHQIPRDEWDATLELNLTAPWYLSCRARDLMAPDGGVILNVASTASYFPSRGLGSYCVSKSALLMLTRACALEWARDHVRVLGMAPGKVDTDLVAPILRYTEKRQLEVNPQRRVAAPAEAAELAAFLVSDAAAYMTGVVVPIEGGELLVAGAEGGR